MNKLKTRVVVLFLSGLITLIAVMVLSLLPRLINFLFFGIICILVFYILVYFLIQFVVNRFILEQIKPIYKIINSVPEKGKEVKQKPSKGFIELANVEHDVEVWAYNQLQEIERLKDLEKYRKEFVGNVSHELKTPIFNIQGYILTLIEGGLEDPKINRLYLDRADKSIDRMISIIEDLESITKLETGELKPQFIVFDIIKTVEDIFELESRLSKERNISLGFNDKPEKPLYVYADKKRIIQAIANLVINGIKYGKPNGYVHVGFYDFGDKIMLEVSDNGIGIDKKDLSRIFERFFRVDKSRSREQGGTGLGLSIVKHIIEAHNQTINVQSVLDEGTTFTFTLERAKI